MHGSSPRLRGTHLAELRVMDDARFIPAPAGNAIELPHRESMMAVHPRACGERSTMAACLPALSGSSPRLRGTLVRMIRTKTRSRFIPAPAGNAGYGTPGRCAKAVHPRACGERPRYDQIAQPVTGSSPRLRGTHASDRTGAGTRRFIPAPAGNAHAQATAADSGPVHPRACGERAFGLGALGLASGSSPRLRGTLEASGVGLHGRRFIPAPAGNARTPLPRMSHRPVHPRACGERSPNSAATRWTAGSSPRLRGTPRRCTRSA